MKNISRRMGYGQLSEFASDVEAYRIITTDDRKIFHPERTDEVYLSKLTFDQVFNHPTVIGDR
ncbi:hypothetical protein J42TS3_27650 [Paenibacillus vini]|uniref:Uncharacterized protein n=1 Tax=Paenibacillus vini TaxID=1476024 RepID=A0ABQ4MCK3_9BACL|nr:hypothetical protein J42TS3_27650 [Paenibacillus vini]